ncbi:MAG: type II toxin-antitoxin system RelE/ParE family toxin [Candidatus Gastranaerophilaceae bacterium]
MKEVKFYKLENEKEPVKEWLLSLDLSTRVKIIKRLERIYDDNFGDYKQIAPNLYELRFFFGSGYRIYYTIQGDTVVILLYAGDKSDQKKDIEIAKNYLNNIKENKND